MSSYLSNVSLLNANLIYYCITQEIRVVSFKMYVKYVSKFRKVLYCTLEGFPLCSDCYRLTVLNNETFDGDESGVTIRRRHGTIDMRKFKTMDDFVERLNRDRMFGIDRYFYRRCVICEDYDLTINTTRDCDRCRDNLSLLSDKENFLIMQVLKRHRLRNDKFMERRLKTERRIRLSNRLNNPHPPHPKTVQLR